MSITSDLLNRTGINLEQQAVSSLGSAIVEWDELRKKPISSNSPTFGLLQDYQLNTLYGNGVNHIGSPNYYTQDYDRYQPKSKFLFKVWFHFNEAYEGLLPSLEGQGNFRGFCYVVKTIDKPKVNYEYQEVNMYNFRTKVLKTLHHEPISMSLHDDISNSVLDFFNLYRTSFSPTSRLSSGQFMNVENDGMSFGSPTLSANSGKLMRNSNNFLKSVTVAQIYASGVKANFYEFINPRIETFDFDNMDMESSLPHGVTVSLSYDGLYFRDVNLYQETIDNWIVDKIPFGAWGSTDVNTATPSQLGMLTTTLNGVQPGSSKGEFSANTNFGPEGGGNYNNSNPNLNKGLTGIRSIDGFIKTVVGSGTSILDQSISKAVHNKLGSMNSVLGPITDVYMNQGKSTAKDFIGSFF